MPRLTKEQKARAAASALSEYMLAVQEIFNADKSDIATINYWRRVRSDARKNFESFGGHSPELAAALAAKGITYNGLTF